MALDVNDIIANVKNWIKFTSGEIRIELFVTATLDPSYCVLTVTHNIKLFEGTLESTSNLVAGNIDQCKF